jgi:hypothetical protein
MSDTFPDFQAPTARLKRWNELNRNLQEVVGMLLEDGEPKLEQSN